MNKIRCCFFLICLFNISLFAQKPPFDETKAKQNLKAHAEKMGAAFIAVDYKTFAKFTNPRVLQLMGGEAKMAAAIEKSVSAIKAQGMSVSSITFSEPKKIVQAVKELQCTVEQHTEISQLRGKAVSTSILIAVSSDNGANWTFIDTSSKDMATLRKILPNLSKDINIPASK
jgi:hypothetical protein